nr:phage major capsid protein [uncultured Aminipila sp.]
MEINGVAFSFSQNSVEGSTKAEGSTKDAEQKIDALEKKKVALQQQLEKEDSPFALGKSKAYEATKKEIEQLDQQIEQLKASKRSNPASEASSNMENNINKRSNNAFNSTGKFDEFIRSEDQPKQPSSGIYSISSDENGSLVISLDQQSAQKGSNEEDN